MFADFRDLEQVFKMDVNSALSVEVKTYQDFIDSKKIESQNERVYFIRQGAVQQAVFEYMQGLSFAPVLNSKIYKYKLLQLA